jgi:acetate---CoA ligase (ADP-forming)
MDALMKPSTIAVVGATNKRVTRGNLVLKNIRAANYEGKVYTVHPNYDEIEGFPCYPAVSAIPVGIDSVVAAIPAPGVAELLEESFAAGVRGAVVLASGFGEAGHAEEERVARLRALASRGMAICGPNCYGVFNLRTGAATFSGPLANPMVVGSVAVVSQSGGFSSIISDPLMEDRGVGFSFLVSCGNQLGTSVESYLEYFVEDPGTKVIAAFVEGFREPWKLEQVAARGRQLDKPIIVLKAGRTVAGKRAALSHTGSISGSAEILASMLNRYGILQVDGIDELTEAICLFAVVGKKPRPHRDIIVITGSGGEGAHVADAIEQVGLGLATLTDDIKSGMASILPDFGATENPVDGTGTMFENPELLPGLLSNLLGNSQCSLIAINLGSRPPHGDFTPMRGFARIIADFAKDHEGRFIAYTTSALGPVDRDLVDLLHAARIPFLLGTQRSMKAISLLLTYAECHERPSIVTGRADAIVPKRHASGVLPFLQSKELLQSFGICVAETVLAKTAAEAKAAARLFGYPVALKLESTRLVHKSDAGCVILGCRNAAEVSEAFTRIEANAAKAGVADIDGALVQPMADKLVEVFAGITADPILGPAVVFGLGGIFIETINDTVTEIPPIDDRLAIEMIHRLRGKSVLFGGRGTELADVDALAKVLVALGDLALTYRDTLVSADLNPLMVGRKGQGAVAVDALLEMRDSETVSG